MFKSKWLLISSIFVLLLLIAIGCDPVEEIEYTLKVSVEPEVGGTVQTDGDVFPPDTVVTLKPEATMGWEFIQWGGENGDEVVKTTDAWQILMDDDKELIAIFADTKFVNEPQFNPEAGEYSGAQEVEIFTNTPDATIHYTLDGTEPTTEQGKVYSEPISITENTTIKAIAFKEDMVESDVVQADYTIFYELETKVMPEGTGEVIIDPDAEEYVYGTSVDVEGVAASDYLFSRWEGDLTGEENPKQVTIDRHKVVKAVFVGTSAVVENIEIVPGQPQMNFDPAVKSYEVTLRAADDKVEISVTTRCPNAQIKIEGQELDPEEPSHKVALDFGENPVEIKVISEDGSNDKSYNILFHRQGKTELKSLELSGGALDPNLHANIDEYIVRAPYEEETLILYPTAWDPQAIVKVDGEEVPPGGASREFDLIPGETTDPIIIEVIGQDGTASRAYEVKAYRSFWEYVGGPAFSEGGVVSVKLFVENGVPYVAYNDNAYNYRTVVQKFDGEGWQTFGEPGYINGESISLFVQDGIPYVAYQDSDEDAKTTVRKYEDGHWSLIGEPGFTYDLDWGQNIIIDDGTIYISYSDGPFGFNADNGELTVRKFDGQEWVILGERRFTPTVVFSHDFAIVDGTPYVVYRDGSRGHRVSVRKFDGNEWVYVGEPGFTVGPVDQVNMEAYDGQIYITFQDDHRFDQATVMTFKDGEWDYVGTPGLTREGAGHPALSFDDHGNIFIAYMDHYRNSRASVQKFDGTSWDYYGDPGFSGGRGNGTRIVVADGEVYVSFWDGGYGFGASVMRYVGE